MTQENEHARRIGAASAMNLCCGALSIMTSVVALFLRARSLLGALLSKESSLVNYENFIRLLPHVLVPRTAVKLAVIR